MNQTATNDVLTKELSLNQQSAIDLLVSGKSDTETAELLNLARPTVTKWRLYHPAFQAGLEARRGEVWGAGLDRLRSLVPIAIDAIAEGLANPLHRLRTALSLLRLLKLPALLVPKAPSLSMGAAEDLVSELERVANLFNTMGGPVPQEEEPVEAGLNATEAIEAGVPPQPEAVAAAPPAISTAGNVGEQPVTPGNVPERLATVPAAAAELCRRAAASNARPTEGNGREHSATPVHNGAATANGAGGQRPREARDGNGQERSDTLDHARRNDRVASKAPVAGGKPGLKSA